MNGTKSILDRINNLISEDSKVLKDFNKRIDTANKNKTKAEEEKKSYEKNITNIQGDIDSITKASEISDRFSNLDEYMPGLEKLGKTVSLLDSLKEELSKIPEQIESLENKIKELTDETDNCSKIITEAEDELSKLDVELSDAKRYQDNLIELIDLSKSGNINKTREEVVETLVHVGFTDKDAITAAKVILFPEDDLIPYFNSEKSVKETESKEVEENVEEEVDETESETKEDKDEVVTNEENEDISLDTTAEEITLEAIDDETKLNPVNVASEKDFNSIKEKLNEKGFDSSKFSNEDLDADEDVISKNIEFLIDKDIDKEFVYKYPSLISDSNLQDNFNYIIDTFNKTAEDIKLTPEILVSYTKEDLERLVEVTNQNGIDHKLIPLSVYLKGLQPFLRNYLILKDNNIELDDNELFKFAIILSVNPVDFKKSLQILLDYHLNLKKNDGKYALMDLAIKDVELANKMDMIIGVGEEELLKYYPEVLAGDVKELVNRLIFLKKSEIPYKTQSHNKVVYQSFVLRQEVLDKVLEKHVELNELLDKNETNKMAKELIHDENLMDELDKIDENFEMVSNTYMDDYKDVIKLAKFNETDNSYIVGNYCFSKNKVNRNINYLLSVFTEESNEQLLLASLFHDSRLSSEDMQNVINALGIKVK